MRLMRESRAKARGYADYWDWRLDRQRSEMEAAEVLQRFLVLHGEQMSGSLQNVHSDPPDVLLITDDGRRIGIEVTELVDSDAVRRHRVRVDRGEAIVYDWANWTPNSIAREIHRLAEVKDGKLAKAECVVDEWQLAIVTDEGMIDESTARKAVDRCRIQVTHIGRAFFLLGYNPRANVAIYPDQCAVLQIPLI